MEKLKNGEIDLLCNAQYTEARAEVYDYARFPLGYAQGLLYTNDDALDYEDFQNFNGLVIGAIKDSATTPLFLEYAKRQGFTCTIVDYTTEQELLAALDNGEVAAICSENMASLTGYSLLAEFSAGPYSIISYQGFPHMEKLNAALQEIKTSVDFETGLYHKYYDHTAAANALRFTKDERDYIAAGKEVTVGLMQDRPPFSKYDADTGTFSGICVDVLASIAEQSGLTFTYIPMEQNLTTPELLASGRFDVICGVERDNFATNDTIVATSAFLESPIVPVGRASYEAGAHRYQHDLLSTMPGKGRPIPNGD